MTKAVYLITNPFSTFHFGKYAPDSDTSLGDSDIVFHSDTLFSSLIVTYTTLFDDTNDFVKQFDNGNIIISSINYFLEFKNKVIHFLPKPVSFNLLETDDFKNFNKIAYVSKKIFESLNHPSDLLNDDIIFIQDIFAVYKSELEGINNILLNKIKLVNNLVHQKVFVSKEMQGDDLYQRGIIEIADNSLIDKNIKVGFYFLIETKSDFDNNFMEKFKIVLEVLQTNGIGGEKGNIGQFESFEIKEWSLNLNEIDENYKMSLSYINPDKSEIKKIKYGKTLLRGGRKIGSGNELLKVIRLLEEGSLVNKGVKGTIADIKPEGWKGIPFLRYGKAFLIDINKNWLNNGTK